MCHPFAAMKKGAHEDDVRLRGRFRPYLMITTKRLSLEYSGEMKRKLSVACATIGNPNSHT